MCYRDLEEESPDLANLGRLHGGSAKREFKVKVGLQCVEVEKKGICFRKTSFGSKEKKKTNSDYFIENRFPIGNTWTRVKMRDLATETIPGA